MQHFFLNRLNKRLLLFERYLIAHSKKGVEPGEDMEGEVVGVGEGEEEEEKTDRERAREVEEERCVCVYVYV